MIDNLAPQVDTYINTNFMEERIVDSQSAYPSISMSLSKQLEAEMADSTWMVKEQLMKPIVLSQFAWTTSQARDTSLYKARFPQVLGLGENLILRTLRMYAFYKLSPCFRVQINATQFHQGQLICSFDPFTILQEFDVVGPTDIYSYQSATGLPNVKVMASESDAVELCVPFIHPRSFLTTNGTDVFNNLGTFDIRVMNQLLAATGASPSLTVTVWLYAKDAEVHVPIYDHDPILEPTSKIPRGNQNKNLQEKQITRLQQPTLMDHIQNGIGQATGAIGNLLSGNVGQALRKGQGLIDTLGSVFGFDYPAITISPPKTITPVENLAVAIGQSQSKRMAIDPASMHIVSDDIASETMQAMDALTIVRTPMFMNSFSVNTSQPIGSPLLALPVHPRIVPVYQGNTTANLFNFQETYLSWVSNAFVYWSGGIVYDFEIVATRFHSAKLLVCYSPNEFAPDITLEQMLVLPNAILDIQQTSKLSFVVPFTSSTSMKNVAIDSTSDVSFTESSNGTLMVALLNTLAIASNVAPSIQVNVYISAADDFSLYVPRKPEYNIPVEIPPSLEATSGIGITHQKNHIDEPTTAVLSKQNPRSIHTPRFGEDYSLRDIIKRFTFASVQTVIANEVDVIGVTPYTEFGTQVFSYLNYFGAIYSAWTGSIRYKYVFDVSRSIVSISDLIHLPDNEIVTTAPDVPFELTSGYADIKTVLAQDNAIEVEVPYYSKYNLLLTRTNLPAEDLVQINGTLNLFNTATENLTFHRYTAAGDDLRFIYLRPPPLNSIGYPSLLPS